MALAFYNSLTRSKEAFDPVVPGRAGIYMCGPTVYSEPHLGHARGPVVFDVLRRWLAHSGYRVRFVSNVTDVGHLSDVEEGEDKLQKRAQIERLEPMEVAEKYFWAYFDAMARMNVMRPDVVPRASGHVIEQIELTRALLDGGYAYVKDGNVYFDVSAYAPYGALSGRDPDELLEGTRVEVRSDKDDPRDFALWKKAESGHIMRWPSPWGEGFPGWHIECSVMSTKYLGDEFDIHGGGLDLIFPHHECEIAQARAAGKPFARVWLHWNMITLEGEKMAKSKNHFVTLSQLFERYDPIAVRFHLLRSHYRSVSDFSDDSLTASDQGLKRLRDAYRLLGDDADGVSEGSVSEDGASESDPFLDSRERFAAAMDDDLNTPQALAVLFDAAREVNRRLEGGAAQAYRAAGRRLFEDLLQGVLGIPASPEVAPQDRGLLSGLIGMLLDERQRARARRDFETADAMRARLAELGIEVEDAPEGSRWKLA